jgi:hypothetical protein
VAPTAPVGTDAAATSPAISRPAAPAFVPTDASASPAAASPGVGWTAQPDHAPVAASAASSEAAPAWAPIGEVAPATPDAAATEDDEDEAGRRPRHPYTWLHLIVLALVAFVLGFLIMLLVVNGRPDNSAFAPVSDGSHAIAHSPPA